jgi:hypothetical protein
MEFNKNQNTISGIHNYCDRWCERCAFTNRCAAYDGSHDESKEKFVEKLGNIFETIKQDLEKRMAEWGIPPPTQEELDEAGKKIEENRVEAKKSPLAQESKKYVTTSGQWLKEHSNDFDDRVGDLVAHFEMGIRSEAETLAIFDDLKECLEVIRWFQYFIHVKFIRALQGKIDDAEFDDDDDYPKDHDGSAKIALIACEKSLAAWLVLREHLVQDQDAILPILAQLQRIIRLGDVEFTEARNFVRPGFDE